MIDFREKYGFLQIASLKLENAVNESCNYIFKHETILKERDANKSVCGVFLDFAKAFDCVNHQILLHKLEHCGVRGI